MQTESGRVAVATPVRTADRGAAQGVPQRLELSEVLDRMASETPVDAVVLGGGCAGLALAAAIAEDGGSVAVVESKRGDRDGRTWCYWDTGDAVLPEAASRSWDRWEIRTAAGSTVASDPDHPYRMVRAHDYRAAARRRVEASSGSRIVDGTRVVTGAVPPLQTGAARPSPQVVDARGQVDAGPIPAGRVALHQRFVGRWIRTTRPVFDDTTVTLMDFATGSGEDVRFFYVLPVAPDLALVECTVFARSTRDRIPFRDEISAYLRRRWALRAEEWTVEGEEAGCITMTDASPDAAAGPGVALGMRAGIARPSTGYAFTRIQVAARAAATAILGGVRPDAVRDRLDTRVLDAIFLRFLRDRPEAAPAVFLRMFDRLPGPLTVRFLTERASLLDELRLILALPKRHFLRAAAVAAFERAGALVR